MNVIDKHGTGRTDIHGSEGNHDDCADPARCDCDCRICKRTWETAGRPSPPWPEAPKYRVEGRSLVDIAAKLVYLMKLERDEKPDAHVNKMQLIMRDGSKVTVQLSKKPADGSERRGIEIDGARLG